LAGTLKTRMVVAREKGDGMSTTVHSRPSKVMRNSQGFAITFAVGQPTTLEALIIRGPGAGLQPHHNDEKYSRSI